MGRKKVRPKETGVLGTADRTAEEVPLSRGTSGGGSVMRGDLLTEGQFIPAPKMSFIDSPFGQKYVSRKSRALSVDDIVARVQGWAFDVRGIHESAATTVEIPDQYGATNLLQDWYPLVRDMGKRSLKYKHLPLELTAPNVDMLRYYLNFYFVFVANTTTLLNLNRLLLYSHGMAILGQNLPRYMSRINRVWRRASALPVPNLIKAHALRSGMITYAPEKLCPTLRFWSWHNILTSTLGGPTLSSLSHNLTTVLTDATTLGTFVTSLETIERWLEIGSSAIITDFVAMKDLIDMTSDVVPDSFTTGLPDARNMPGLIVDPGVLNDMLCRAIGWKFDKSVGIDQIALFPIPEESLFGGRIPVAGWGAPSIYDFTLLGNAKFGSLDSLTDREADVGHEFTWYGTDIPQSAEGVRIFMENTNSDLYNIDVFGRPSDTADEILMRDGSDVPIELYSVVDWESTASIIGLLQGDHWKTNHIWHNIMPCIGGHFTEHLWARFLDEAHNDYIFWAEDHDFCENYSTLIATTLGIPYLR